MMKNVWIVVLVAMVFQLNAFNETSEDVALKNLKTEFGNLASLNILEIGCNDGQQCFTLAKNGGFSSYTILTHHENIESLKKYLIDQGVHNVIVLNYQDIEHLGEIDLLIGKINEDFQFIDLIISRAANGHLMIEKNDIQNKLIARLIELNKSGKMEQVKSENIQHQTLLTWRSTLSKPSVLENKSKPKFVPSKYKQSGNAVTYTFSGGRFGDNLVAYFHAKWLAMKYGLLFIYEPFPYSEQLKMDTLDPKISKMCTFRKRHNIKHENELEKYQNSHLSTLLKVSYFPEIKDEWNTTFKSPLEPFIVDWKDPVFKKECINSLQPIIPIPTVSLPTDKITVGVHVRRGGDFESYEKLKSNYPLKFAPDSYYIEQLKRIAKIFENESLYVYILTDDKNPGNIADTFRKGIGEYPNIEFNYRDSYNNHNVNVLTDFFSIPKFDCFICSGSNFPIIATKLGHYRVLINPVHGYHVNGENVVEIVEIEFNGKGP